MQQVGAPQTSPVEGQAERSELDALSEPWSLRCWCCSPEMPDAGCRTLGILRHAVHIFDMSGGTHHTAQAVLE